MGLKYLLQFFLAKAVAPLSGIDYAIIAILLIVIAAIIFSMIRHRREGSGCYGCPHSQSCKTRQNTCPSDTRKTLR